MIKLTVEGVVYEFDDDKMLIAEAREIKTLTGLSMPKMFSGIEEGDPDSLAAIIFLAKKRAGETLRFSDLDSLDYADILLEPVEPPATEAEGQATQDSEETPAAASADPTPPSVNGTTQTDATGDTSPTSPTTSSTPQPTLVP